MLQTLLVNLKLHFREKAQLFWLFAFPIILATMFNGMFGNIAESYALHTVDVVVVNKRRLARLSGRADAGRRHFVRYWRDRCRWRSCEGR